MAEKFTNRKGKIRLYDGTGTPFYLEISFDAADLSAPSGRPLVEEIAVLDRGSVDANAHYITGPQDVYMQALEMSFSALVTDLTGFGYLQNWIEILNGDGTTVNSNTIVTTKGTTQNDGSNNNPAFADSNKLACNVEYLLDGASADQGWQFNEVYFPHPQVSESDEGVSLALAGQIYGTITTITAFTSGTDVAA